jgi:hypothetical protein
MYPLIWSFFVQQKSKSGVNLVEIFEPVSTVQTVKRVHGQCILCRMIDHVHHFDIYIYILYIYIGCLIPLPAVKGTWFRGTFLGRNPPCGPGGGSECFRNRLQSTHQAMKNIRPCPHLWCGPVRLPKMPTVSVSSCFLINIATMIALMIYFFMVWCVSDCCSHDR